MTIETLILLGMPVFFATVGYYLPVKPYRFNLDHLRFDATVRELEYYERLLRSVRRDKKRLHLHGLCAEWQAVAACLNLTDFEFEWFLVSEVWAMRGEQFRRYRLAQSPYRREIEILNNRKVETVAYA